MPIRLHFLFQQAIQKSRVDLPRLEIRVPQNAAKERNIRLDPAHKVLIERPLQTPDRLSPIRAVADQLGQQGIVIHGHGPALVHAAVPPDPGPRRRQQKNFYFLEMNTRLQVEHPVTELVTGLDLVHLQIRIANGERLPFAQDDVTIRGHAIECRIYAEDPDNNYFPSPGKITLLLAPSGPGIRRDSGMYEGWTVPMDYDPLLAKLIGYGTDREQAIGRLTRALSEYFVGGIKTNISLFRRILRDPNFRAAKLDTGFLDRMLKQREDVQGDSKTDPSATEVAVIAAGMFAVLGPAAAGAGERTTADASATNAKPASNWKSAAYKESVG